jgi:hypothetical protein
MLIEIYFGFGGLYSQNKLRLTGYYKNYYSMARITAKKMMPIMYLLSATSL